MWQSLVRNWLHQQAREKAWQAVQGGAAGGAKPQEEQDEPGPPPHCDVGLVFALGIESGGLEDKLEGVLTTRRPSFVVRQGGLRGRSVVILEAGPGKAQAAKGTDALIAGHKPDWIISAGFAGALQPNLKRHDILMVDSVVDLDGHKLAIDLRVDPHWLEKTKDVHAGRLLTVDKLVGRPEDKLALGERHEALAVDMETMGVAEVCRREKIRFLAVRVISDPVDEILPADLDRLLAQPTTAGRLGAATGAIFRRPSSVKDMLRLKENALLASDKLASFLSEMILQLAPPREKVAKIES